LVILEKKNNNNFEKPENSRIDEIHGVFFSSYEEQITKGIFCWNKCTCKCQKKRKKVKKNRRVALLRLFFADASMFNVAQRSSRMLSPT